MKLIKPSQISGEIMTLMEEADEKVILVSPYFKVSNWQKLLKRFDSLKDRKIPVEIYVREAEWKSIEEVKMTGFEPITIPNLHTKLYLNEKYAIVSSMNLLQSSDAASLDIAYQTETKEEYEELVDYYNRYIKQASKPVKQSRPRKAAHWKEEVRNALSQQLNRKVSISDSDGKIVINAGNQYEAFIGNGKTNDLRISGILTNREFLYAKNNISIFQGKKMQIEVVDGKSKYYDTIWGTLPDFKSSYIHQLDNEEDDTIADAICKFIVGIEQLKLYAKEKAF
jgi:hypothetical protein